MRFDELPELPVKFRPSQYMTVPEKMVRKNLCPLGHRVSGTFPSRIHVTPIDCNMFAYGRPGGGGIGFAISSNNRLELTFAKRFTYEGPRSYRPVVQRALTVSEKAFNLNNSFRVVLDPSPEMSPHSGLGSNAIIMSAILFATNALFNKPFSDEEVRFLVAANFAESGKAMLCPGLETGLASAVMAYGGFNLVGGRICHIWQHPVSYMPNVYLVKLDIPRPKFSGSEDSAMLTRSLREDLDYRGMRSYAILMDLIPAIVEGNLKAVGDAIWRIQFGGTHLSMIQAYRNQGSEIYDFICHARAAGIEIVGMSSVGPTFFLIASRMERIESLLQKEDAAFYVTTVNSNPVYSHLCVE